MIAPGADRILALRRQGKRPGEDVVISLVGQLPVEWLVMPDPDTDYDWLPVVDLSVWVVVSSKTAQEPIQKLLRAIRVHRPKVVRLWIEDLSTGYELWFRPTMESVTRAPDKWEWLIEPVSLLPPENQQMAAIFAGEQA